MALGAVVAAFAAALIAPPGGTLALVTQPDQGYAPIYRLLASAKHDVDLTMYEFDDANAESILAADAHRGVRVRVLLDHSYIGGYNDATGSFLRQRGVHVRWASTQVALTHEKSAVVDGRTAVIMTGNLTSRYYSTDRDFAVVDTQPSDVAAIEQTFVLDWANRPARPAAGADLVWSPGSEQPLVSLIGSASHSLLVENEEIRAPSIVTALEQAARRGVQVDLTMTRSSSWYGTFDELVRAGVHVSTYSPSAALYIHAKAIDVDGARVFLGSENFSVESMDYNRELGVITASPSIRAAVGRTLAADFAGAAPWRA